MLCIFFISEQSKQSVSKSPKTVGADRSEKEKLNSATTVPVKKRASAMHAMPFC